MRTKMKKMMAMALLVIMAVSISAMAADIAPRASIQMTTKSASLVSGSSTLYLSASVSANQIVNSIGVSRVALYDETTGSIQIYGGASTSNSKSHSGRIALDRAVKGHSYHAVVTFFANSETATFETTSKTF